MLSTWPKKAEWKGWIALDNLGSVAQLIGELIPPETDGAERRLSPTFGIEAAAPDVKLSSEALDEFQRQLGMIDPSRIRAITIINCNGPVPATGPFQVHLFMHTWRDERRSSLRVQGEDRTAVEGVFSQLREAIDARIGPAEFSPAGVSAAAEPIPEVAHAAPMATAGSPGRRWWSNPWVVGIGTTVVGGVITGVILILIA